MTPAAGTVARPCPYCEDQAARGCGECGGTGLQVTTYIDGARVTGSAVPSPESLDAIESVIAAARILLSSQA